MKAHRVSILAPAIVAIVAATAFHSTPRGNATTIIPRTIAEAVASAQIIFAGRVTAAHARWTDQHHTIVTRIAFDEVTVLKGSLRPERAALVLAGGRTGRDEIAVDGQPKFSEGAWYVVFCTTDDLGSESNSYIPTLGMYQGVFRLGGAGGGEANLVLDPEGRPIIRIDGDRLVVLDSQSDEPSGGAGTVSVASFDQTARVDSAMRDSLSRNHVVEPPPTPKRVLLPQSTEAKPARPARTSPQRSTQRPERRVTPTIPTEPTCVVVKPKDDPGHRLSASEFLASLRRMIR